LTLSRCRAHERFQYRPGLLVKYLRLDSHDRATSIIAEDVASGEAIEMELEHIVLAAGTLSSARIFLETLRQNRNETVRLSGLMDNRQILMPFVTLAMMGRRVNTDHYQYHQLMMALEQEKASELVHCQITTLKSAAIHPIVQAIPLGLSAALRSFREIRAALGIANVNLPDFRRADNYVTLGAGGDRDRTPPLEIRYSPPDEEAQTLPVILRRIRRCLWKLGALAPAPMTHVRPMGASVHYAGTLPMCPGGGSLTTSAQGRSHDIPNLHLVDGSTFCSLPAKNLTFTLMANARRIAHAEF
jgi:choline dehydrogenase-like flavoprotein